MPCHSWWSIGHRQLVSIQLCPALPPPSSSSCIWNPPSTFHSRAPASVFIGGPLPLWPCDVDSGSSNITWFWCNVSVFTCGRLQPVQLWRLLVLDVRSGSGVPVVGECEGDYRHDSRKNILEWRLPVIDTSNKSGSMEFTVTGHANDFFPVTVNFVSKKSFCDIEVCSVLLLEIALGHCCLCC